MRGGRTLGAGVGCPDTKEPPPPPLGAGRLGMHYHRPPRPPAPARLLRREGRGHGEHGVGHRRAVADVGLRQAARVLQQARHRLLRAHQLPVVGAQRGRRRRAAVGGGRQLVRPVAGLEHGCQPWVSGRPAQQVGQAAVDAVRVAGGQRGRLLPHQPVAVHKGHQGGRLALAHLVDHCRGRHGRRVRRQAQCEGRCRRRQRRQRGTSTRLLHAARVEPAP